MRRFEDSFKPSDKITLKIDIDDNKEIQGVIAGSVEIKYQEVNLKANKYLLVNSFVPSLREKTIKVIYRNPQRLSENYFEKEGEGRNDK